MHPESKLFVFPSVVIDMDPMAQAAAACCSGSSDDKNFTKMSVKSSVLLAEF
jgi:hypothetical protein